MPILKQTSSFLIRGLEKIFYRWGKFVTVHPWPVIFSCFAFTAVCSLGFLKFRQEHRAEMLWIPPTSEYIQHKSWLGEHFAANDRGELLLYKTDNVLTPHHLQEMYFLHKSVMSISSFGKSYTDICSRIPIADIFQNKKRRKRQALELTEITEDAEDGTEVIRKGEYFPRGNYPSQIVTEDSTVEQNYIDTKESTVEQNVLVFEEPIVRQNAVILKNAFVKQNSFDNFTDLVASTAKEDNSDYDSDYDYNYDDYEDIIYEFPDGDPNATDEVYTQVTDLKIDYSKYGERDSVDHSSHLNNLPPQVYCDLVNTLNDKCLQRSLLEIFQYSEAKIFAATQQDIIDAVNLVVYSPWYGYKADYSSLLGSVVRNETGHIVAAGSAQMFWSVHVSDDVELVKSQGTGLELDLADKVTLDWEDKFIDTVLDVNIPGVQVFPNAVKSFSDVSTQAIFFDSVKVVCGYGLMFIYTMVMLGKINRLEMRMYLAITGIFSVLMGIFIAVGLSSLLGYPFTPMHAMLPFLCLGIGIDDMFVIVQCWTNLKSDTRAIGLTLPEKLGLAMKHAGVSVTVTSLTDVFAFGVGAVTKMPGLESFCVCCAIALGSIFLLQVSWFVAWMSLDERRIESGRDGIIPCIVHKDYQPPACTRQINGQAIVSSYAKLLSSRIYKFLVILFTTGLLGFGIWGSILMRMKFDPVLLMPADSYLRQWVEVHNVDFPKNGWEANIYTGHIGHNQLEHMDNLANNLEVLLHQGRSLKEIKSWWTELKDYAREEKNFSRWQDFSNERDFKPLLTNFLFSSRGSGFKSSFEWDGELVCNQPAPDILASKFSIVYLIFDGPEEHIPAKRAVEAAIENAGFNGTTFAHAKVYAAWETDEIIGFELWRNIGLAMLCVFVVTFILLANLPICLMVLACVILTLVDIVGLLHFWDITIDTLSMINIVLAIGLCVDYSVHIAHAFLVAKGTRLERAVETLTCIGPAVLNGGITTFLALSLLGFSTSHVFITFFKVFLLTVAFGLYHGLVFFPVVLTLVGPQSSSSSDPVSSSESQGTGSTASPSGSSRVSPSISRTTTPEHVVHHGTKDGMDVVHHGSKDGISHDNLAFVQEIRADEKHGPLEQPWLRNFSAKSSWRVKNSVTPVSNSEKASQNSVTPVNNSITLVKDSIDVVPAVNINHRQIENSMLY